MPPPFPLPLDAAAVALPIDSATTVVLRGAVLSRFDGALLDGAMTHWPPSAPGAPPGEPPGEPPHHGLVDFEAGGLEVVEYDADAHEVHAAVRPGAVAAACARHGTTTPCLVLRTGPLAHQRLLTTDQWLSTLQGGLMVELAADAPVPAAGPTELLGRALRAAGLSIVALLVLVLLVRVGARALRARRPLRRFTRLVRSVRETAATADPVLAQLLTPALDGAARAVRRRSLNPCSAQGQRLARALEQLRAALLDRTRRRHQQHESDVVDALAREIELALDAEAELSAMG